MLLADSVWEELTWKNKKIRKEIVWELLEKLKLENNTNDFPLALSKGQRLRVVLGALLARNPNYCFWMNQQRVKINKVLKK